MNKSTQASSSVETLRSDDRAEQSKTPPAAAQFGQGRRLLRRCDNDEVFAYAMRGSFFRARDHIEWAHEHDHVLVSARSGVTLARRVGDVFYDVESSVPLYYEANSGHVPRSPSNSTS